MYIYLEWLDGQNLTRVFVSLGERLEKVVAMEAVQEKLVEKAGLNTGTHIQGKNVTTDTIFINEDDRKRHVWHR